MPNPNWRSKVVHPLPEYKRCPGCGETKLTLVHSPWSVVAPDLIRCAIDRALICEAACCPGGCEADRTREYFRPFKRDQALLPNRVAERLTAQLDAGT